MSIIWQRIIQIFITIYFLNNSSMKKSLIIALLGIFLVISSCSKQGEDTVNKSDFNTGALSNTQSQVTSSQLIPNHE